MNFIKKKYIQYKEIINYLIVGGLTTILTLFTYFLLTITILDPKNALYLQIANVISWIVGVLFAYVTNRKFVFESKNENKLNEFIKFVGGRVITLLVDVVVMHVGVSIFNFNDKIIKLVSQVLVIILNYILSKFFVFNREEK